LKNTEIIDVRKIVIAGLLIALGVILPMAFHSLPYALGGRAILPMHIPVLLAGLICGPLFGLATGIITPLLSHAITGMPPSPILPAMVFELAAYGAISGIFMLLLTFKNTKNLYLKIYVSLIGAMLIGRVIYGAVNAFIFNVGDYSLQGWLTAAFVTALPGIVIQILAIPSIVVALQRERLINIAPLSDVLKKLEGVK